ncbi:MAG: cyclodeaminase/cyclohydrolase family protein [Patescibacteria group bacterium]
MTSIKDQKVKEFLKELSSSAPTPGGGAAAALAGAVAAGLVGKVAVLTLGEEFKQLENKAIKLQSELLKLADEDCQAYDEVVGVYRLSKKSEKGEERRKEKIQEALKKAAEVPLETAKKSLEVLRLASFAAAKGNQNCLSDARCGIELATAAIYGALENVRINLKLIEDEKFTENLRDEIEKILAEESLKSG